MNDGQTSNFIKETSLRFQVKLVEKGGKQRTQIEHNIYNKYTHNTHQASDVLCMAWLLVGGL